MAISTLLIDSLRLCANFSTEAVPVRRRDLLSAQTASIEGIDGKQRVFSGRVALPS